MTLKPYSGDYEPIDQGQPRKLKPYSGNYEPIAPKSTPAPPSSTIRRVLGDSAVDLGKGIIGVGEAAIGLADIATGGYAGRGLSAIGYDPATTKKMLEEGYTPERVAANQKVSDAHGFIDTTRAMLENPSTILGTAVESAPLMFGGGAIARGAGAVLGRMASPVAAAIPRSSSGAAVLAGLGEGAVGSGIAAEQLRQGSDDGLLGAKQTAAAIGSGIGTGALAVTGGMFARRLGISDIDTAIAGGGRPVAETAQTGLRARMARLAKEFGEGVVSEGVLEELPQNVQEQMWQNFATNKPIMEGVPESAAQGMLAGAAMGGPFAMLHGSKPNYRRLVDPATGQTSEVPNPDAGPISRTLNIAADTGAVPTVQAQPDQAAPSITATEVLERARRALEMLDQKANGTPDMQGVDDAGNPIIVPGEPKQVLTDAEKANRQWLSENKDDPHALAARLGRTLVDDRQQVNPATGEVLTPRDKPGTMSRWLDEEGRARPPTPEEVQALAVEVLDGMDILSRPTPRADSKEVRDAIRALEPGLPTKTVNAAINAVLPGYMRDLAASKNDVQQGAVDEQQAHQTATDEQQAGDQGATNGQTDAVEGGRVASTVPAGPGVGETDTAAASAVGTQAQAVEGGQTAPEAVSTADNAKQPENTGTGAAPTSPGVGLQQSPAKPVPPPTSSQPETEFSSNLQSHIAQYREQAEREAGNPDYYNADLAKEMFPEYSAGKESRRDNNEAVGGRASKIAFTAFEQRLQEPPTSADATATLMAGGTGSGKSVLKPAQGIVYDSTMYDPAAAKRNIQMVLDSGRNVEYRYVFTQPESAFRAAIARGQEGGRFVNLTAFVRTHEGAYKAAQEVLQMDDARVVPVLYNNTNFAGREVESLPKYDYNGLRGRLEAILNEEHAAGRVSDVEYRAIAKTDPPTRSDASVAGRGTGRGAASNGSGHLEAAESLVSQPNTETPPTGGVSDSAGQPGVATVPASSVEGAASYPITEHTTGKGKVLRGTVRRDLTQEQAKAIDPYTMRKDGGYFIREKHFDALRAHDAATNPEKVNTSAATSSETAGNDAGQVKGTGASLPKTEAKESQVTVVAAALKRLAAGEKAVPVFGSLSLADAKAVAKALGSSFERVKEGADPANIGRTLAKKHGAKGLQALAASAARATEEKVRPAGMASNSVGTEKKVPHGQEKQAANKAKAEQAETERTTYNDLLTDPAMVGKSAEELAAAMVERAGASGAAAAKAGAALQKAIAKRAAEAEKERNRDPQVLRNQIIDRAAAAGLAEGQAFADFNAGFGHAMAGKTKSTLAGEGLADMMAGYKAAKEWLKTEEGRAYFEGRPTRKLENTGADLRRHMDMLRREAEAAKSDGAKLWEAIKKATVRATLFPINPPSDATPGATRFLEYARAELTGIFDYLSNRYGDLGFNDGMFLNRTGTQRPGLDPSVRTKYSGTRDERMANLLNKFLSDEYAYYRDQDAPQSEWVEDRMDPYRKIAPLAVMTIEKRKDVIMGWVSDYIVGTQRWHAALSKAKSAKEGVEIAAQMIEKHEEEYRDLYRRRVNGAVRNRNNPLTPQGEKYDSNASYALAQIVNGDEKPLEHADRTRPLTWPRLDAVERDGLAVVRGSKDVTPQEAKDKLGFADIGFGNWVNARTDQDHLNYAFDAFMDLAKFMGLPSKMIGFGGELHFTIGALGHGRHAAHFQLEHPHPSGGSVPVINVTNTKGDGTVAHEWGHALDLTGLGGEWPQVRAFLVDALRYLPPDVAKINEVVKRFLTGASSWTNSRGQTRVEAAIYALTPRVFKHHFIDRSQFYKDALILDKGKGDKPYWSNDKEMIARSFESFVNDTLGGTNTYLVNPDWVAEGAVTAAKGYRGTPYPMGEDRKRIIKLWDAVRASISVEDGKLVASMSKFKEALGDDYAGDGEVRRQFLLQPANMEGYLQEIMAEREAIEADRARAKAERERKEREEADRAAAEALAALEAIAPPAPSETTGPLTEDDLSAIFDEAAAELREDVQEQPEVPPPGQPLRDLEEVGAAAAATVKVDSEVDKTAAKIAAEAAKLGVEGLGEAMQGLVKLFGGRPGQLNSFPAGFDENTYKAAKPHFKAALAKFQEAGKTLKDLFKFLIQQFGDGVKQYAVQFAKDEGLSSQLGSQPSASIKLADWVQENLRAGRAMDWRALFEQADAAFGGTQAEGTYTPKDAYDALEAGINRYIMANPLTFSPQNGAEGGAYAIAALTELLEKVPTQSKRTAETDAFQQFSTVPPLAYAANWVANVGPQDTMLEPSAGIGGLAVFAHNAGAKLVLNELSSRRAAVLQEVFPGSRVFHENAEQLDNILPADVVPSVVVMNPPFSNSAARGVKKDTSIGAQHVEQALGRLADGGRLVAIVGDGMRYDAATFRKWWDRIAKSHSVRAVLPISGKGYAKYGTAFDNVLLVIDKVAPAKDAKPLTTPVESYTQLIGLLTEIRNDRKLASVPAADREQVERDAAIAERDQAAKQEQGADESQRAGVPGSDAVGERAPVPGQNPGRGRIGAGGARSAAGSGSGVRQSDDAGDGTGEITGGRGGTAGGKSVGSDRRSELADASGVAVEAADRQPAGELTDSIFEGYQPQRLKVEGAKPHPGPLVQSAAMASVLPPAPTYTPNLPKATIEKGLLSLAQIEAVVYAGQAHSQTLQNGERRGFFIGDGTGVGKGREISGILLDNLRQGRTKAVWVSEKPDLMKDAQRDFKGVGGDEKLIFSQSKVKATAAIPGNGIAFTTYATLRSGAKGQDKGDAASKGASKSRIDQLVQWLGEDFDGVIAFDEAHNAGNAVATKGKRGNTKPSEQALAVVDLQKRLPNARVVYVSATGATEVSNLSYATRLGLWGEGTPFTNVSTFINQMAAGGLANMELVARDMKQMGMYLARSLSFEGVTYSRLEHQLSPVQRDIYDRLSDAWQVVLQNFDAALEATGALDTDTGKANNPRAVSAARSAFWGGQQRFFNQVITSMQMPAVLEQMEKDVAAGKAVVLQIVNTNEAAQERALAKKKEEGEESLEDLDLTPRDQLMQMVEKSFPVVQMETFTDMEGKKQSRVVEDSEGNPVLNKKAVAMRDKLLEDLKNIKVPDGPLEMVLNHFGPDMVAEVTGRSRRVVRVRDADGNMSPVIQSRGAAAGRADAQAFMDDKKQILIFSDAGGTGFSFHADRTQKNRRKRAHYLIQPGWRADKAVQGFGRTHRTNQDSAPHYYLAATDIPAHKRFLSSIARRLDQLGALTKGQRDTANQGMFSETDNLESIYATQAIQQLMEDGIAGRFPGFASMLQQMGLEGILDPNTGQLAEGKMPPVSKFLNRMLSLKLDTQVEVFDAFITRMEQKIETAVERGEFDAGMQTIKAISTEVVQDEVIHTDPRTKAETHFVELKMTLPNTFWAFPDSKRFQEPVWIVNKTSGKVYLRVYAGDETTASGAILPRYQLRGTGGTQSKKRGELYSSTGDLVHYEVITEAKARELWEAENAARPASVTRPTYLITGVVLPIWDRLDTGNNKIEVVRTQTADGKRLLGRQILPADAREVRKRFNVSSTMAKLPPLDVMKAILQGKVGELANGWHLQRAKVSDELRIEVKIAGYVMPALVAELNKLGVISERINWAERLFIPVGPQGVPVLQRLFENRPLVDLADETASAKFSRPDPSLDSKNAIEYANAERDLLARLAQWSTSFLQDGRGGPEAVEERPESIGAVNRGADHRQGAVEQGDASKQEIREQSARLIDRAKREGFFWGADSPILAAISERPSLGGAEHQVFLVGEGRNRLVIRATDNGFFGPRADISPAQYLARLEDYSHTFPGLQTRLIGVSESADIDGHAVIWTAQPFVEGEKFGSQSALEAAMAKHGWKRDGYPGVPRFIHEGTGAVIEDARTDNVFHDDLGNVYPFDVVVEALPKPSRAGMQSRPDKTPPTGGVSASGQSIAAVRAALTGHPLVGKAIRALEKRGKLVIVNNPAIDGQGWFANGVMTLNAAYIRPGTELGVLLHEGGTHAEREAGARGILGDNAFASLTATLDQWANGKDAVARDIVREATRRAANDRAQRKADGEADAATLDAIEAEERLAYAMEAAGRRWQAGQRNPSAVASWLNKVLARVKLWLAGTRIGKMLRDAGVDFAAMKPKDFVQIAAAALQRQAVEAEQATQAEQARRREFVKGYAFSKGVRSAFEDATSFARSVRAVTRGDATQDEITVTQGTPDVFARLGVSDRPFTMLRSKMQAILKEHPEITESVLQQLVRQLHEPVAVFMSGASSTNPNGLVSLAEFEFGGKPVMIAIHTGVARKDRVIVNRVASYYGKDSRGKFLNSVGELLYIDQSKAPAWLTTQALLPNGSRADTEASSAAAGSSITRLQLPRTVQTRDGGSIGTLLTDKDVVKPFTSGIGVYSQAAPNFYSALLEGVQNAKGMPKKGGDAAFWKGWMDGAIRRGEFKQAERDWLGVDAWLDGQGTVTREQLADFIRANEVQVEEVTLGGKKPVSTVVPESLSVWLDDAEYDPDDLQSAEDWRGVASAISKEAIAASDDGDTAEFVRLQKLAESASNIAFEVESGFVEGPTKFSGYQLPGGMNYRELLLTLPEKAVTTLPAGVRAVQDGEVWRVKRGDGSTVAVSNTEERAISAALHVLSVDSASAAFKSSHFDQPNILAHVRFNERTDADGKRVLFLEEIQSDWHQAGRKGGYRTGESKRRAATAERKDGFWEVRDQFGAFATNVMDYALPDATEEKALEVAQARLDAAPVGAIARDARVPDAPFKATDEWAMLAFKRMVRHAAENGFDRIAWTTGEQQAERYDLSKQVDAIRLEGDFDQSIEISIARPGEGFEFTQSATKATLADVVGKEIAEKALNDGQREFRGLDLKVGGAGMRAFYDKILPAAVNKWAKRFGAKVGTTTIVTEGAATDDPDWTPISDDGEVEREQHSIDITPAMRDAALGGLPLFSRATMRQPMSIDRAIIGSTLGRGTGNPDYAAAKAGDREAGLRIAQVLVDDGLAQKVRAAIGNSKPVIVPVVSVEAKGRNKIPRAAAEVLAQRLGLDTAEGITQANAPKRTALDGLDRIFAAPEFTGEVVSGQDYLLLDDTLTQGGTFAALASHIEANGGHVVAAVALTGKQYSAKLALSPETLTALREKHGDLESDFRAATGYGFDALTESEARYLTNFKPATAVRDRILAERGRRRQGVDEGATGQTQGSVNETDQSAPPSAGPDRSGGLFSRPDAGARFSRPASRPASDVLEEIQSELRSIDQVASGDGGTALGRLRQWLKDATPEKIKNQLRSGWLGALATRHLTTMLGDYFPSAHLYTDYLAEMEADRNAMQAEGDAVAEDVRKWAAKNKRDAQAMFDLAHRATIDGVDPAEDYQPLQFHMSGKWHEVNKQNVKDALAVLRDVMLGRGGDDKRARMEEAKGLRAMLKAEPRRRAKYPELVAAWNQLSPEAQKHYRAMRDLYRARNDQTEAALIQKINDLKLDGGVSRKQVLVNMIRMQFEENRRQGVYFPLQRFGQYFVAAEKEGIATFRMYEKEAELTRAVAELRERGFTITARGLKSKSKPKDAPSGTFVAEVLEALEKAGVSENTRDDIYQMYLQALPEMSMRKHKIHRKSVPGWDPDAVRAFAYSQFHTAHQLARLRYGYKLADTIEVLQGIQDARRTNDSEDTARITAGDALLEELRKRHEWISNPQDSKLTNLVSSFGFTYYLGVTPAAALVNLTQVPMLTLPWLGSRFGAGKALATLTATMKDAISTGGNIARKLTDPDEVRALQALEASGALDRSLAHNLAGIAEGGMAGYNPAWSKTMEIIGKPFHVAEVINREATGVAAFRLARASGMEFDAAVKFAAETIHQTQFDYSNANRARFMQSGTAKVLFMFRQYSLNLTWHIGRMVFEATKGADPQVRALARRNLAGLLGMSALFSGTLGLPLMSMTMDVLNALAASFGDDDDPWDAETEFRAFLIAHLGRAGADTVLNGVVDQITGASISSRVSYSDLWFRDADRELDGRGQYYNLLEQAAGPMGGVLKNAFVGKQMIDEGHVWRGVETMLPKALKDVLKAGRYASEGVNNLRGDPIVADANIRDILMQGIGFMPSRVRAQYDVSRASKNYEQYVLDRRGALLDAFAMSVRLDDDAGRAAAMDKIRAFNARWPELAITPKTIIASLRSRARYTAQAENGIMLNRKIAGRIREAVGTE